MAKRVVLNTAIRVDMAQFKQAMSRVKSDLASTGRAIKGVGIAAFATATTTASLSLARAAKHFDRIGKLSKQFGSSTNFLQNVAKSAELAGVNLESVARIQKTLSVNTRDAADGLTTYVRAFEDLGINVKEFQSLDADGRFLAFSKAIAAAGDNQTKLAAAIKLGGRATADALPLLKDYKQIQEDINKEAALSKQQIQNIEAFNDSLATLKQTAIDLAGPALSALNEFIEGTKVLFGGRAQQEAEVEIGRGTRNEAMRERERENDAKFEAERAEAREARRRTMAGMARRKKFGSREGSGAAGAVGLGIAAAMFGAAQVAKVRPRPVFEDHERPPDNVFKAFPPRAAAGGAAAAVPRPADAVGRRGIGSTRALAGRQDLGVQGFNPLNSMSGAARKRHQERLEAMRAKDESADPALQRMDKQVEALQSIDEKMTTSG